MRNGANTGTLERGSMKLIVVIAGRCDTIAVSYKIIN